MKKIPTLFLRDSSGLVTRKVNPNCEWVIDGEGDATRKFDGTCVLVDGSGKVWSRREVKAGKDAPEGFELVEVDSNTGKQFGWEPYEQSGFAKFIEEALLKEASPIGTYELCGPKINGNPEKLEFHRLIPHGEELVEGLRGRDFDTLWKYLCEVRIEGIVWWHPDGRKAKIKAKDFGINRK